jgi:hypothetical protein
VEFRGGGGSLSSPMAQIREWLDNERIEPTAFRLSLIPGGRYFSWSSEALAKRRRSRAHSKAIFLEKRVHALPYGAQRANKDDRASGGNWLARPRVAFAREHTRKAPHEQYVASIL